MGDALIMLGMRYFLWLMLLSTPVMGAEARGPVTTAGKAFVPVPVDPSWIGGVLVWALWLTVAAIILGPIFVRFQLLPKNGQAFADDRAGAQGHSAASTTSH